MMSKDEVIDLMHSQGFAETLEESMEHDVVIYSVTWTRISDGFQGPTFVSTSATEAFTESAYQTLDLIDEQIE